MKISLETKKKKIRETYLTREESLFREIPNASFKKIKDWDNKGSIVIWKIELSNPLLSCIYRLKLEYGPDYPFRPPKAFLIEPPIKNQRHQNPATKDSDTGSLCLFPEHPDCWNVGITCKEIIQRIIKWLQKYETRTLNDELAPPEIERYFPSENVEVKPVIILAESLLRTFKKENGWCSLIPSNNGKHAFLELRDSQFDSETATMEIFRLRDLILPKDTLNTEKMEKGLWFHVDREPPLPVPLTSADLAEFIGKHAVGNIKGVSKIAEELRVKPEIIAIWYKAGFSDVHWLVFRTNFSIPPLDGFRPKFWYKKFLSLNRNHTIRCFQTHHLSKETIFRRVAGYDVELLSKKICIVLGCGSIGSRVAETLIKSGVGRLILVDNDVLRVGNISRHILGLDYLGQNKADALREILLRKNPYSNIQAINLNITRETEKLYKFIESCDQIISCLGRDSVECLVNEIALYYKKPVIYCRSYIQSRIGEIVWCNGKSEPCFQCAATYLSQKSCPIPKLPELTFEELVSFDTDCGSAFIPASAVDLDLISLHCIRIALSFLEGRQFSANYWLIRGREFAKESYPDLDSSLREPFQIHQFIIPKDNQCSVCFSR